MAAGFDWQHLLMSEQAEQNGKPVRTHLCCLKDFFSHMPGVKEALAILADQSTILKVTLGAVNSMQLSGCVQN